MQGCKSWLQRGRARAGVSPDTVCFCARLRQGEWYSGDDAGVMRQVVAQVGLATWTATLQSGRPMGSRNVVGIGRPQRMMWTARKPVWFQWAAEVWSAT
jgi:hypothetical protein